MVRLLIVLFWVSLIVGTYVTGNVLGNWVVCLLALFFFIRSRRRRDRQGAPAETAPASDAGARRSPTGPLSPSGSVPLASRAHRVAQPNGPRRRWH
jgi:hypothetical protein